MKNKIKSIWNKIRTLASNTAKKIRGALSALRAAWKRFWYAPRVKLAGQSGEGYVDSAVKIIIALVVGALLLGGLYTLFRATVIPEMTEKVTDMFSYSGT